MESSGQERPMESRGQAERTAGVAGDQNAGLVNFLHVLIVLTIVGYIVGLIVIKV